MRFKEFLKSVLIIFLIFILVEICYSKFIKKEYPVKLFGMSFLCVTTGSMEPIINSGELIVIKESSEYKENDIVTYSDNDGFLITHRIIDINESKMITKGDNNNINDDENNLDSIQGKVVFHSQLLGFFVIYVLKPLIFIYVIILVSLNFYDSKKKERTEDNDDNIRKVEENCN